MRHVPAPHAGASAPDFRTQQPAAPGVWSTEGPCAPRTRPSDRGGGAVRTRAGWRAGATAPSCAAPAGPRRLERGGAVRTRRQLRPRASASRPRCPRGPGVWRAVRQCACALGREPSLRAPPPLTCSSACAPTCAHARDRAASGSAAHPTRLYFEPGRGSRRAGELGGDVIRALSLGNPGMRPALGPGAPAPRRMPSPPPRFRGH
jgi:hypothetical protein